MGTFENVFKVSKKMAAMPDYNYMYVSTAYPPSSRGEHEVYCERCTRLAACSHRTHTSIHHLLFHNLPVTHTHTQIRWCSQPKGEYLIRFRTLC